MTEFETKRLPVHKDAAAPDGSDVRVLLIPNLVDTDPFHGGGLALPVRRAARRDAGHRASRAQYLSGQP